ncbi:DNA-binding IclR family transcriptional regulator [Rhizobium petrolearium]|uniref:IclR family transcriptional regulator n=1 Tax=Neorhizobium petrolearium TaxID=515361 RepID=UPI001AEB04C1|nr:IclR family transcriptional regulator [Neorhizobium petrolearium]MBP1845720.1 DNA-binding IclR family transcriptional regulator [Neorhizobium petrolearium]
MSELKKKETDDRRGIQSVEVGFSLIQVLAQAPAKMPLKTLAAAADMIPSKAHLYLVSFTRLGLVVQDPVTARYGLGPAAIRLGIAAINQLDVVEVSRRHLERFLEIYGISVSLAVWSNRGPTIIYRVDGRLPVPASVRVGHVLPVLQTATGRIFMAYLPEKEWKSIASSEASLSPDFLEWTSKTLNAVRSQQIAVTNGQLHTGFFGVSAPIFDNENRICAAVSAHGLSEAIDLSPEGPIASGIRAAAREISTELGAAVLETA